MYSTPNAVMLQCSSSHWGPVHLGKKRGCLPDIIGLVWKLHLKCQKYKHGIKAKKKKKQQPVNCVADTSNEWIHSLIA